MRCWVLREDSTKDDFKTQAIKPSSTATVENVLGKNIRAQKKS